MAKMKQREEGHGGGRSDFVPLKPVAQKTKLERLMEYEGRVPEHLRDGFRVFARQITVHALDEVDLAGGMEVTYMAEKGEAPGKMSENLKAVERFLAGMQMPGIGMGEIQRNAFTAPDSNEKSLGIKLGLMARYAKNAE